ncbi:hypothetical protein BDQ12DRAFT_724540 [Crucibulum laeve]|uniref:Uncharacterized protein n=1 Tax=Crucibulum laeve TaxID=68775 RepID=A0A5C3M7F8_9AGAR|nr:hypothetical protein BDQ12DRAFT_724540 [Crucibulum laeve]
MKVTSIAPAVVAIIASAALTNASPIPAGSADLVERAPNPADSGIDTSSMHRRFVEEDEELFSRDLDEEEFLARELEFDLDARDVPDSYELERRGGIISKISGPKKDSKASYNTGNPRPETPTGEFRKFTAGRNDDYFGDWQSLTGGRGKSGVNNPAAGKGKKKREFANEYELERRGGFMSKIAGPKKDRKASYKTGNPRPETPAGEFRKFTAGRHDDYFGDWQTMTGGRGRSGVDNPAAGRGRRRPRDLSELEVRGNGPSKPSKPVKDSKASYDTGNPRPETPTGEFRKFTAGKHDDYFGDWQSLTGGKGKSGVDNPAAGKGKKKRDMVFELETRGNGPSKPSKPAKDSKASYDTGNPRPETPTGEFRKFTAGKHDDYFGDWQSLTGGKGKSGVDNPAAGKGKKKREFKFDLEVRGNGPSKPSKPAKDSKASYDTGNPRPETPTGEFRKFTAGKHDDYFGDWQSLTGGKGKSGVDNPAAGKGKKKRAVTYELDLLD